MQLAPTTGVCIALALATTAPATSVGATVTKTASVHESSLKENMSENDSLLMQSEFFFENAMILSHHGDCSGAMEDMKKLRDPAFTAFSHAVLRPGPKTENMKEASRALQLVILSQIMVNSYDSDSDKILPFALLDDETKTKIQDLIELPVRLLQRFHDIEEEECHYGEQKRLYIMESLLEKDFEDFREKELLHNLFVLPRSGF